MKVAVLAFEGFDAIEAFLLCGLINRLAVPGWKAEIASPSAQVTSMHGVSVTAQQPLEFANEADVVLFGGGIYMRALVDEGKLLDRLSLDPLRQLIGAQSAGVLALARLGLLGDRPACTDAATKPWLIEAGVRVEDAPFAARGPVATAGGSLASLYLAAWVMARGAGIDAATQALHLVAPVGEKDAFASKLLDAVRPSLDDPIA